MPEKVPVDICSLWNREKQKELFHISHQPPPFPIRSLHISELQEQNVLREKRLKLQSSFLSYQQN